MVSSLPGTFVLMKGPTELVQEAGNDRCHTCLSDFVERLEN
jgi:hypothetical protein